MFRPVTPTSSAVAIRAHHIAMLFIFSIAVCATVVAYTFLSSTFCTLGYIFVGFLLVGLCLSNFLSKISTFVYSMRVSHNVHLNLLQFSHARSYACCMSSSFEWLLLNKLTLLYYVLSHLHGNGSFLFFLDIVAEIREIRITKLEESQQCSINLIQAFRSFKHCAVVEFAVLFYLEIRLLNSIDSQRFFAVTEGTHYNESVYRIFSKHVLDLFVNKFERCCETIVGSFVHEKNVV